MTFVAIDFETANACLSSVCQIGVVTFDDNSHTDVWQTLVNPDDHFDGVNVSIHGITEDQVKEAPKFPQAYQTLRDKLADKIVVHHTAFDKIALTRATDKHGLPSVECQWLDTSRVARMTWPELGSYKLVKLAEMLGIKFQHHAAHEDARATGQILLEAVRHSGVALADWLSRIDSPYVTDERGAAEHRIWAKEEIEIAPGIHATVSIGTIGRFISAEDQKPRTEGRARRRFVPHVDCKRTGEPDGPLAGETIVFTGSMAIPRSEAADLAAAAGCNVGNGVTKKTTLLVVGDQDLRLLAGHEKSSKHRKAEDLIAEGQAIRILGESDFKRLIGRGQKVSAGK